MKSWAGDDMMASSQMFIFNLCKIKINKLFTLLVGCTSSSGGARDPSWNKKRMYSNYYIFCLATNWNCVWDLSKSKVKETLESIMCKKENATEDGMLVKVGMGNLKPEFGNEFTAVIHMWSQNGWLNRVKRVNLTVVWKQSSSD